VLDFIAHTERIRHSAVVFRILGPLVLTLLLSAGAARALTFQAPAQFATSGTVTFLAGPTVTDTPTGFILNTDVQLGNGTSFLIAYRSFQIGPLPEEIQSSASEQFKIVLSGGGSGTASAGSIAASVAYSIFPDPLGPVWPSEAAGGSGQVTSDGLLVITSNWLNPLNPVLPPFDILSPGLYQLRAVVRLDVTLDPLSPFPQSAFAELGGISSYAGIRFDVFGTPVPEPTTAVLMALGLIGVATRARA
jgi:hypothetical protein